MTFSNIFFAEDGYASAPDQVKVFCLLDIFLSLGKTVDIREVKSDEKRSLYET